MKRARRAPSGKTSSLGPAAYRSVVEASPASIVMIGEDGRIVLVNSQTERIFGYARRELIGKPIEILVPPRARPGHPAHRSGYFAAPEAKPLGVGRDLYGLRKDGTEVPVEIGLSPIKTRAGTFALASIVDITARKQAEEALRESETRYRTLFENMINGLAYCRMIFDGDLPRDFVYLAVNNAFEAQTGLKDVAGRKVTEVIPGIRETDPHLFEVYARVARTGKPEKFETYVAALRQWFAIAVYSTSKDHFVAVFDVITERKKAERAAQIEAANEELESFNAAVAHDLKGPIRRISAFNELLENSMRGKLDAESLENFNRVKENVARMGEIVDALLNLSRLLQQKPKHEAVDLTDIAARLAEELQRAQPHRRVQFVVAKSVVVHGDPALLRIVLRNLLENSWKYTARHAQAKIEFGVMARRNEIVYFVRDDGAGFDMAHAGSLFKMFKRLHGPREFPGIGIGLVTVARVVKRLGGRIWPEAAVERGATFYFTLGPELGPEA